MARNPVEILLRQNIFIVGICSLTGQLSPGEASLQKQGWAVSLYTGGCKYMTFFCQFNVDYRVPSFLESRAWVNVILLLFFFQNIPVVTSEQHPGSCCSVQPSSKILAVCGVKCTVWCTPEVTVRPKTKGKKTILVLNFCFFKQYFYLWTLPLVFWAYPGRYELHVWYPKSFPSHSSAPSKRYPSPQ